MYFPFKGLAMKPGFPIWSCYKKNRFSLNLSVNNDNIAMRIRILSS